LLRSDRGIRYKAECQNISCIHTYIHMHVCKKDGQILSRAVTLQ